MTRRVVQSLRATVFSLEVGAMIRLTRREADLRLLCHSRVLIGWTQCLSPQRTVGMIRKGYTCTVLSKVLGM